MISRTLESAHTPADQPSPEPLSALLRSATRVQHERAESSGFVEALMAGRCPVPGYLDLLVQYRAVYAELERFGDAISDTPAGAGLVFGELRRLPAIDHDLRTLVGPHWESSARLAPATERYVARLAEQPRWAGRYAAHAYTRYLGDLSGGQVLRRALHQHYDLDPAGLTFFDFPEIPKPKPFKDLFRSRLDEAPFDDAERDLLIAEARLAFDLNTALFTDLAVGHLTAP